MVRGKTAYRRILVVVHREEAEEIDRAPEIMNPPAPEMVRLLVKHPLWL